MSETVGRRGIMVVVMGMMIQVGFTRSAMAQPALVVNDSGGSVSLSLGAGEAFHTTDRSVQDARVVTVPDSSVTAIVWKEVAEGEADRDYYALSPDGAEITRVRQATFELKLRHGEFDPVRDGPRPVASSLTARSTNNLYIVQFVTQSLEAYRDALTALGAAVYNYMPKHAHIVKMTPAVKLQVESLDFVRSVVPFHPAYRLADRLRSDLEAEFSSTATERYAVMTFERGPGQQGIVANRIESLGGTVHTTDQAGFTLVATMTLNNVRDLLTMDEVQFINLRGEPVLAMDVAREISGANFLAGLTSPDVPFTGTGVRGEVMDSGLRMEHNAFQHPDTDYPIARCYPSYIGRLEVGSGHGTMVYGEIFGDGTNSPVSGAKGILPDGEGIFSSYFDLNDLTDDACQNRSLGTSLLVGSVCCPEGNSECPYQAVFQSNSWGSGYTLKYEQATHDLDDIAFTYDIVICQAQGNCGNPSASPSVCLDASGSSQQSMEEAWAKNVISVGGIRHYEFDEPECRDYHDWCGACPPSTGDPDCIPDSSQVCVATCASEGLSEDYRVKPDLAHFYDNVLTTADAMDTSYTPALSPFTGTSAATPIVCGYVGLVHEMWASDPDEDGKGVFGNDLTDPDCDPLIDNCVFVNRPHMTTAKALVINTAYRYPNDYQYNRITRETQGWGMPDVEKLYQERDKLHIIDETILMNNLGYDSMNFGVVVTQGEAELRVTLVYADPPGTPLASVHAVNDLDLKVTSPTGSVYWGNCGLLNYNWSLGDVCTANNPFPGISYEIIDTVENVFIQNPVAGTWNVEISTGNIAMDGHVLYVNDDPTECCCPVPPGEPCPTCVVPSPTDADFALVVAGVTDVVNACCDTRDGSCSDTTEANCQGRALTWDYRHTCDTIVCPSQN